MVAQTSPVTGVISENAVVIDFGKHEGLTVSEVAKTDPDFYSWLVDEKNQFAIRRHKDKTFRLYINPLSQEDQ